MIEDKIERLCRDLYTRDRRRIGAKRTKEGNDFDGKFVFVYAFGRDNCEKIAKLYEAWFSREIVNSQVPIELEFPQARNRDLLLALIDFVDAETAIFIIQALLEKLSCQSTSVLKGQPMQELLSSVKLLEEKKSSNNVHSSEAQDDSSTKSSNELASDDKTAT